MLSYLTAKPNQTKPSGHHNGWFCPACGHHNADDAGFCFNCAASRGTNCPVCRQLVISGSKFCPQCGAQLSGAAAVSPADGRGQLVLKNVQALIPRPLAAKIAVGSEEALGERREVTVLCLRFVGSHNWGLALDEETLFFAKDEALQWVTAVIDGYEGTIDKFTGDGAVALFGAPITHENDPERAVRAALEIQTALQPWQERLRQETGLAIKLAIGINTGFVVAGLVGNKLHQDYTVIGETVNLAQAVQETAKPGTVLVSYETYQRVWPEFEFQPGPSLRLEGRAETVQLFQPLRIGEKLAGSTLPKNTPLTGRANDLLRLKKAFTEAAQQRQSRIVLVSGEAGLGKSRLVTEFRRALAQADAQCYQGECVTFARSTPLWVVTSVMRELLGLVATHPPAVQQQLQTKLEALNLAGSDLIHYLTYGLGLESVEAQANSHLHQLDATMLRRQTYAAFRQVLLTVARQQTLVLIFENMQLVDPASRDFLEYLSQSVTDAPLLLVFVTRSFERQTTLRPLIETVQQNHKRLIDIQLQPLTEQEAWLLVDHLFAQRSSDLLNLKQQIIERAGGNPLFLQEIIRMLIEQGGLKRESRSNNWVVTPQAGEFLNTVPGTIRGLILARFDRLPEGMKRTLYKAAVFGSAFPLPLMQVINDAPPEATTAQFDELVARQFLLAHPFRSVPGYAFQHTLQQETIYQALIRRDRSKIHTQIAQAIECSPLWLPEEQAEVLAYHYSESTFPVKAVPYLITAGENAAGRCAYETAIKHFRRAIRILPPQPAQNPEPFFRARLGLGNALKFVGELTDAGKILTETLHNLWYSALAVQPGPVQTILVESLRQMADVRQREGSYEAALRYLDVGIQLLGDAATQPDSTVHRALLDRIAWIHFRKGQLDIALAVALSTTEAVPVETVADPITLASLYNTLGGIAWQQGRLEQAIDNVRLSMQLYDQVGYMWGVAIAYGNLGILSYQRGNWSEAVHYYEQAQAIHQTIGNPEGQAINFDNLGLLSLAMGDYPRAQQELETALTIRQRLGDSWGTAQTELNLAQLALAQARFAKAGRHTDLALALAGAIGSSEIQVEGHWVKALIRADNNRLPEALQAAETALAEARQAGLSQKEPDCLRVLGSLQRRSGQFETAEPLLQEALKLSQARCDPYQQGQIWLELGRLYRAQTKNEATVAFETAAGLFERLGAKQQLQQAHAALAQM
ncbi:MAG: hypothetical protein FOGNACKC_04921 [Anaerolineae bacterium]|nr:hypothetical protein [Anaerolineae bacterium]